METDEIIARLAELVENLAFDYDRMSQAGKQTYEEICSLIDMLTF